MPEHEKYETSSIKLWSLLRRRLAACGQVKASPEQWLGTLRNLQKKGVSAVEVEWSGIMSMLGEDTEPDCVLNKLVASAASLEGKPSSKQSDRLPRILHIKKLLEWLAEKPPCDLVLQRRIVDEYAPVVRYEKQQRPTKLTPVLIRQGRREVRLLRYMDRTFGLCVWLHVNVDPDMFGHRGYWSFSVPRGVKKLAPQPVGRRFSSALEAMAYGRVLVERMARRLATQGFVGPTRSLNQFTRFVLPGGDNYTEWLITAPNLPVEYWGDHFELPNIVAHVRTTERMTPAGARLLVLEEIQSDWNQALRKALQETREGQAEGAEDRDPIGWGDDMETPPENPYLNHWLNAALRMMLVLAANQGFAGLAWLPGILHAQRFPWANAEGLKTFYDLIVPAGVEKLAKSWGARLDVAQFSTLSRHFDVRKLPNKAEWQVCNVISRKVVGENFTTFAAAEAFRRSREDSVLERISTLYLSHEMRDDIRANGLPYLGAVGTRRAT
jgi:hypothetical protein